MEISLISIAVIGFIVGIITNIFPYLGNTLLNFLLAVVVIGIWQGLQVLGIAVIGIPLMFLVFAQWYFIGTFTPKILAIIPSPLQPYFMAFSGH